MLQIWGVFGTCNKTGDFFTLVLTFVHISENAVFC